MRHRYFRGWKPLNVEFSDTFLEVHKFFTETSIESIIVAQSRTRLIFILIYLNSTNHANQSVIIVPWRSGVEIHHQTYINLILRFISIKKKWCIENYKMI